MINNIIIFNIFGFIIDNILYYRYYYFIKDIIYIDQIVLKNNTKITDDKVFRDIFNKLELEDCELPNLRNPFLHFLFRRKK